MMNNKSRKIGDVREILGFYSSKSGGKLRKMPRRSGIISSKIKEILGFFKVRKMDYESIS